MDKKCTLCDLHQSCFTNKIEPDGVGDIVFLGEAPGADEDNQGIPFVGDSGAFLRSMLELLKIDPARYRFTNAVRCRPPRNKTPTKKQLKTCLPYLVEEFIENPPTIIVPLGNTALSSLREAGLLSIPGTIMALHGKVIQEQDVVILPMVHPAYILRSPQDVALYKNSMEMLEKIVLDGITPKQDCDYYATEDIEDLLPRLKEAAASGLVAYDIETSTLHPRDTKSHIKGPYIVSFALSWKERQGFGFYLTDENRDEALKLLHDELLENPDVKKIMHHAKFELRWSMALGRTIVNFADTMLIHWHVSEKKGTHSLDKLAADFTDLGFYDAVIEDIKKQDPTTNPNSKYKDEDGNEWSGSYANIDQGILMNYNCTDTDATYRIHKILWPQLNDKQKWIHDNIQIPICYPLAKTELDGVSIDWNYANFLDIDLPAKAQVLQEQIMAYPEVQKYAKDRAEEGKDPINFNSGDQLATLLFNYLQLSPVHKTETGKNSTNKNVLEYLAQSHEIPALIMQRRSLVSTHSNFVRGLIDRRMGDRVHTSYGMAHTDTGRLTSTDPNFQNIKRGPLVKTMFVPDDNDWMIQFDYSQIELRVLAIYSGDKTLISYFEQGLDVHRMIAAKVHKKDPEQITKEQRTHAKRTVFGLCYGQGAKGLAQELGISLRDSQDFIDKFFREFPGVKRWKAATEKTAAEKGRVENLFGRVRRLPDAMIPYDCQPKAEALRQGINSPIQGTAGDMLFYKMAEIHKFIEQEQLRTRMILTVYDSLNYSVPEEELAFFAASTKLILETWELPWVTVPIVCDIEIGKNWGHMKSIDGEDLNALLDGISVTELLKTKSDAE